MAGLLVEGDDRDEILDGASVIRSGLPTEWIFGELYAEADSDAAQRLLRRVRPSHAPLHVNAVHLVDVTAGPQAKTITWEDVTRVPLGTAL